MKKKDEVKESLRLYFTYDERSTGGEDINPEEEWSDRTPTTIEVRFREFYRTPPAHRFFYDSVEVDEDTFNSDEAYLAVVRYSTGDTFGHTDGAWHIVGAANSVKKAEEMLQIALNSKDSYKPWEGYFERFERTEIERLIVRE